MRCKRCGCEANRVELTPNGPHYGKTVCAHCGTFLGWEPRPVLPVDPAKVPICDLNAPLPAMTGLVSERQQDLAKRARDAALLRLEGNVEPYLFAAMRQIVSGTWWIANKDRAPSAIHWPKEWVDEPQAPTA